MKTVSYLEPNQSNLICERITLKEKAPANTFNGYLDQYCACCPVRIEAKKKMLLRFLTFTSDPLYFNILFAVKRNGEIIEGVKMSFNSLLSDARDY